MTVRYEVNGHLVGPPKSPSKAGWVKEFTTKKGRHWGNTMRSGK